MIIEIIDDHSLYRLGSHHWHCYDKFAILEDAQAHFKKKYGYEPERGFEQRGKDNLQKYLYLGPVNGVSDEHNE